MTDLLKRLRENFPENHQTGEVIHVYELERKEAAAEIKRLQAVADAAVLTVEIAHDRGVEIERLKRENQVLRNAGVALAEETERLRLSLKAFKNFVDYTDGKGLELYYTDEASKIKIKEVLDNKKG